MPHATYEDANLIMELYDLRREERLRKARDWFQQYSADSLEEYGEKYPPGSEGDAWFRMVVGYWDMAASFLVQGIVHEELFFETSGEMLTAWIRIKPVIGGFRAMLQNPLLVRNLEKAAEKHIAWLNKNAPGAYDALVARTRGQR